MPVDGVQRDVLHGMFARGFTATAPMTRAIDVIRALGLAAPDDVVYDVIVKLRQGFTTRYPLIDGEGNFGSLYDDPPADPEYTECRLSPAGMAAIAGSLPARLANGAPGVPPHNVTELMNAASDLLDDPRSPVERLVAPDFPTGGVISNGGEIAQIYTAGSGALVLDARVAIAGPGLVVTEIPYGARLGMEDGVIATVADLVSARVIPEITDIADESDRGGLRLVFATRSPDSVRDALLQHTPLRMHVPIAMNLRESLKAHLDQRRAMLGSDARVHAEFADLAQCFPSPRRTTVIE